MGLMETDDIVLRKGIFDDWKDLFKNILSKNESAEYMLWRPIHDEEHAMENARKMIDFQKTQDAWLVYEKSSGEAIGWAGVEKLEGNRQDDNAWADTGVAIGPDFTGKGYGRQILQCLIRYVREEKKADRFLVSCRGENEAARALCQSLGFAYVDCEEKTDPRNGLVYTLEYYECIKRKSQYDQIQSSQ